MTQLDSVLRWIADRVPEHPAGLRAAIALPVVIVGLYLVLAFIVRRILPGLVIRVVFPVLAALAAAGAVVLLSLQAVGALPFRLARRRPPAMLYQVGDALLESAELSRLGLLSAGYQARRLRRFSGLALVVAVILVVIWWNRGSCAGGGAGACVRPTHGWTEGMRSLWRELRH